MLKELINKYWKEFCHWKDDGKIAIKYLDKSFEKWGWVTDAQSVYFGWDKEVLVVINDEYVEFRKALAEGKIVFVEDECAASCYLNGVGGYYIKKEHDFSYKLECYYVKPDEPDFKVGDWVRILSQRHIATQMYPSWFLVDGVDITIESCNGESYLLIQRGKYTFVREALERWTFEDASDDDWVYWIYPHLNTAQLMQKKKVGEKYRVQDIVPNTGQTPKQLGLEE